MIVELVAHAGGIVEAVVGIAVLSLAALVWLYLRRHPEEEAESEAADRRDR